MAKIPLENSEKFAQVDDDMHEYMSQYTWYLTEAGYACRLIEPGGMIYQHDEVWALMHHLPGVPVRPQSSDPVYGRGVNEN